MPTLHIQLFGQFQMHYDNQPITTIAKRGQTLLAYLLLHRAQIHTRQDVAFHLWPDTKESQARSNLRTELTKLGQAFAEIRHFLHDEHQVLHWHTAAPFTLDVVAFEQASHHAELADYTGDETGAILACKQAVDLYTGDLLVKLGDDWVIEARQRLSETFVATLERLTTLLKNRGDYPHAIQYAQHLLHYDPAHETSYRQLMEMHALNGNHAGVKRVYQACVKILQRELDVEPSPITQQLYRDIMRGAFPP